MTKEQFEKLHNNDLYWLALSHVVAFSGPIGFSFLFIVWCVCIFRHMARKDILESLEPKDLPPS